MNNISKYNLYLLKSIPISRIAGVKVSKLNDWECETTVKHGWFNQNPFKSMFWAVQGMAAEFSTGIMCADKIRKSGKKVSMLVIQNNAEFSKKATGKIVFSCSQGKEIDEVIKRAVETGEGQTLTLSSEGKDEKGDTVSKFNFVWSFKVKN